MITLRRRNIIDELAKLEEKEEVKAETTPKEMDDSLETQGDKKPQAEEAETSKKEVKKRQPAVKE